MPSVAPGALAACATLGEAVASLARAYDFGAHPYFVWLAGPTAERARFLRSQVPFRHAVRGFSQALAAVLARTDGLAARMALAENVAEEHGHGDPRRTHLSTFDEYLRALGATDAELAAEPPVGVLAFGRAVLDHCLVEPGPIGAAMLGAIEHLYVGISRDIALALAARGWVPPGGQRHYVTHEALDVRHAEELFRLAEPAFVGPGRAPIAEALALGAHHFWRLYDELTPG